MIAATESSQPGAGALGKCRVLDLTRVFSGPWAAQMLGDLGAEVIKVERPEVGDDSRRLAPFFSNPARQTSESVFFASTNRNKKSITVDLAHPEGQALVRSLAKKSDVLIENYKVRTLSRYGLDYAALSAVNPRLIYCSITGFGQTGPYSHRPGYDLVFQAMSGLMSVTGTEDEPQRVGFVVSDFIGGMYTSISILAALQRRAETGRGQHIDISLLDTQLAALSHIASNYLLTGNVPGRHGTGAPQGAPSQMYRCADREIVVVVGNEDQFARFARAIGVPQLCADERFRSNAGRLANKAALNEIIERALAAHTSDEWLEMLEKASVPSGPVLDLKGVFEHPQVRHRGMKVDPSGGPDGALPHVANPIRFSESPVASYRDAPPLGADTDHILSTLLGLDPDAIGRLRSLRAI
jgi:crotonobetainyl-CoA:carnitine CoA-transferase CaiB-like acyl-CoA transferase